MRILTLNIRSCDLAFLPVGVHFGFDIFQIQRCLQWLAERFQIENECVRSTVQVDSVMIIALTQLD